MKWTEPELKMIDALAPLLEEGEISKAIDRLMTIKQGSLDYGIEIDGINLYKLLISIGYTWLGPGAFELHTKTVGNRVSLDIGRAILEYPPELGLSNSWRNELHRCTLSPLDLEKENIARYTMKLSINDYVEYSHLLKEIVMKAKWLGRVD